MFQEIYVFYLIGHGFLLEKWKLFIKPKITIVEWKNKVKMQLV